MKTITITISDAQYKSLAAVAVDPQHWVENFVQVRANAALDEIFQTEVARLVELQQPIVGTKEDIVLNAPIKSAAEREAEQSQNNLV